MRHATCHGMQAHMDRCLDLAHLKGDVAGHLRAALLRKIGGYSRARSTPVARGELRRWFGRIPANALDIVLDGLVLGGSVRVAKGGFSLSRFTVEHYWANGDLFERTHYDSEAEARAEVEKHILPLAEPGERIRISRRFGSREVVEEYDA
jgi:hypothetical protein